MSRAAVRERPPRSGGDTILRDTVLRDTTPQTQFIRAPLFAFTPHPDAPLFSNLTKAPGVLQELISEIKSGGLQTYSEELRQYLRQAALTQLWFFEKFILGAFGPYEKLNTALHLDMANFAQSDYVMRPGAQAAAFVFRASFKSTILGHGNATWHLIRDPEERICFICNTADRAHSFKRVIKKNFEANPLVAWLFPECVPTNVSERWNDKEIVLPNRKRIYKEPSAQGLGIDSASAGDHFTRVFWDDIAGLEGLDQAMNVTAVMENAKKNFRSNRIPLLVSKRESRTFFISTFYAPDDVSMVEVVAGARSVHGWTSDPDVSPREGGEWDIYYRQILENGVETCPEVMNSSEYEALLLRDPWTALTQYANKPRSARQGGFAEAKPRSCLIRQDKKERWVIQRKGDPNFGEDDEAILLSDCYAMMTVDPAGTDDKITSQTSRSSIGIWAIDSRENFYRIWQRVGYISDRALYDAIFEGHKLFEGYLIGTVFEKVAMQKVMYKQLQREQTARGIDLYLIGDNVKGEKIARIRHGLGGPLRAGKVWLADGCATEFLEEMYAFPGRMMDVLDESEKAVRFLPRPRTEAEQVEVEEADEIREFGGTLNNAFGY